MNKKQLLDYESPITQLINLRIESGILTGSTNEAFDTKNNDWSGLGGWSDED